MNKKSNITLIGMAGCGKSTTGVLLAKALNLNFIDTDLLLQQKYGMLLWKILEEAGIEEFNRREAGVMEALAVQNSCIATGGSAVYSDTAMRRLGEISRIVFLDLAYEAIEARIADIKSRGIVMEPGKTLRDLYEERRPLYLKYADVVFDANGKTAETIVDGIIAALGD